MGDRTRASRPPSNPASDAMGPGRWRLRSSPAAWPVSGGCLEPGRGVFGGVQGARESCGPVGVDLLGRFAGEDASDGIEVDAAVGRGHECGAQCRFVDAAIAECLGCGGFEVFCEFGARAWRTRDPATRCQKACCWDTVAPK